MQHMLYKDVFLLKGQLMFKNYLTTALRNFWGNKFFSLINIIGLAIGLSAALIIYLIVAYDFHFDKFEKDGTRIYRVVSDYTFSGQSSHSAGVPHALPAAVRKEVAGLDVVAPFRTWNNGDVKVSIPGGEAHDGARPIIMTTTVMVKMPMTAVLSIMPETPTTRSYSRNKKI